LSDRKPSAYLETIRQRTVIFDGAMGTSLEAQALSSRHFGGRRYQGCNDYLCLTFPEAVERVHRSFLEAGADVIETNTFRANRQTLSEFGLQAQVRQINTAAAQLARRLADSYASPRKPRFVAGSIGPSGKLLSLPQADAAQLDFLQAREVFAEQAEALLQGGVDLLLLETQQDLLELKAAVSGILLAFERTGRRLPIQAQVTLDANGRMLLGTDIAAVLAILEGLPIDCLGLNCSTGPQPMRAPLSYLSRYSSLPLSCLPNAGMPLESAQGVRYPLSPEDFAGQVAGFVNELGIEIVGGCCGTTPQHIRLLIEKLARQKKHARHFIPNPSLASAFQALAMRQEPAPLIIGERLNTQGSRAFKRLMLAQDYPAALAIAEEQLRSGAHALDVCTALTEDERECERMRRLVQLLSGRVDAPLVIDSTDAQVMEAALQATPGRCLLNSIHLEGGEQRARRVLALARQYNAAVIALTIDEGGMARSAEEKLSVARRIYRLAVEECGLRAHDLVFDPLTFTLASGSPETMDAGLQTLQALRAIKSELPGVFTSLGISNISFGFKPQARQVLNSVLLYHALQAGLDMAILNAAQVLPYPAIPSAEKELAENLLFNRHAQALADFSAHFETTDAPDAAATLSDAFENLPLEERIRQRILTRRSQGLIADLDEYIHAHGETVEEGAQEVLQRVLLPAMQKVGDQFGSGELILPFVLQSAEVMRAASDHLEQYLQKGPAAKKGRLLLATVYGDVHDIGKNLVKSILSNNGYEVLDLGKQVPAERIVEQAAAWQADAIGLSALLVSTSQQMPQVVASLQKEGLRLPLLIGGAAVNAEFAQRIQNGAAEAPYAGGVFYCADAFDALRVLDERLSSPQPAGAAVQNQAAAQTNPQKAAPSSKTQIEPASIPQPPFLGAKVLQQLPLAELFAGLNRSALFRVSWGVKNASGEKWSQYQRDFTIKLQELQADALAKGWLQARAAYGFFRCHSEGDDLLICRADEGGAAAALRFHFPRQKSGEGLCLSDYFRDARAGPADLAALQIVSLHRAAVEYVRDLQARGEISQAFYAHGLAVQLTETAAQYMHQCIRQELGLKAGQGKRYSWGYPAMPDLSQHRLLFQLLPAQEELDIQLTSAFQFIPEYSTAALIVHHPQAAYFAAETFA